jgi:hypothetical protein
LTRLAEYLALGLIASFGLIACAVAFATWQDTTIRTGDDLQRVTRAPLLDAIPHLPPDPTSGGGHHHPARASSAPQKSAGKLDEPATVYPSSIGE